MREIAGEDGRKTVPFSSALKGLKVIEAISTFPDATRVADLAKRLGWPRGTVHRWLVTLTTAGWVEQLGDSRYRLSLVPSRIGVRAVQQADYLHRVLPHVESLASATGEAVSIAVLERGSAVIIQRVDSAQTLGVKYRVGSRMALAGSASGRVLAAYATPRILDELAAADISLPPVEMLETIRRRGFATSVDDLDLGVSAAAVVVESPDSTFRGALSIACPTGMHRLEPALDLLLAQRKAIQHMLDALR